MSNRMEPSRGLHAALKRLEAWFERQKRVLPWRDEPGLYRVWVSEIMLQQTQVATVVPYFERFLARFPTVESLAAASQEDVYLQWAGLGYYSRARNLHAAARRVVEAGGFPKDLEGWLDLPGIGPYTAGAILSIALDRPEAILDGNVERVLSRVRRVSRARGDAAYKDRLWRLSRILVTRANQNGIRPSVLNQALMELGATVCTPRKPRCQLCPLAAICRARASSEEEAFPPRKAPKKWLEVREEVHCVFDEKGRMLLGLRLPGEWRAGLWDFPDSPPLEKSMLVPLGRVQSKLIVTRHRITRTAHVWLRKKAAGARKLQAAESNLRWISIRSPEVAVGGALRKTLQRIRETYSEVEPGH